jgi:hypothetical protein
MRIVKKRWKKTKCWNFDVVASGLQFCFIFFRDSDSEEEGKQSFDLSEKLTSKKFPEYRQYFVKDMTGDQVDLAYFQRFNFFHNDPSFQRNTSFHLN